MFPVDGLYYVLVYCWSPRETAVEKERTDRVPYMTWAERGYIELTPGKAIHYGFIRKKINELRQQYDIRQIAFDRYGATQIALDLENDGFELVQFIQGAISMSPPSKRLEELLLNDQFRHGGNPLLRWQAANVAVIEDDNENIKPTKGKSTGRIDSIVATVMAIGVADQDKSSVFAVAEKDGTNPFAPWGLDDAE